MNQMAFVRLSNGVKKSRNSKTIEFSHKHFAPRDNDYDKLSSVFRSHSFKLNVGIRDQLRIFN